MMKSGSLLNWKDYVDARFESLRQVDETQDRVLDKTLENIRVTISELEKRMNEKFTERDTSSQKQIDHHLEKFNSLFSFRDNIIATRVTREQLELQLKGLRNDIDLVSRAVTLTAGKDTGVSKVWSTAALALSVFATITSALTGLAVLIIRMTH
jgi:hypothetical protein